MFKTNDVCEFRISPKDDPIEAVVIRAFDNGDWRSYKIRRTGDDGYQTIALEHQLTKVGTMVYLTNTQIADALSGSLPKGMHALAAILEQVEP